MECEQLSLIFDIPAKEPPETYNVTPWLRERMAMPGGCKCPVCGRHVQIYRRTITSAMVVCLIYMYKWYLKYGFRDTLHVEGYLKRCRISSGIRGDFPKLRFWGLIEKIEGKRSDGSKRIGYYRITQSGIDFVLGKIEVPKYAITYNNRFYRLEGDFISIKKALKERFNYEKLLNQRIELLV